jgi:hypothetical protein
MNEPAAHPVIGRPAVRCWSCGHTLTVRLAPEPANVIAVLDPAGHPCPKDRPSSPLLRNDEHTIEFDCPECGQRQGYDLADL